MGDATVKPTTTCNPSGLMSASSINVYDSNASLFKGMKNPQYPLPTLESRQSNYEVWKRKIEGWFNSIEMDDPQDRFETIINSIKINSIVEDLVKQERLLGRPLTLDECIPIIRGKLTYQNSKKDAFQQIKILTIRPHETIEAFNKRFLDLFYSLGTEYSKQVSVYDYMNALKGRFDLHQTLILRSPSTIEDACQVAKNYEYWQEYNTVTYGQAPVFPPNPRVAAMNDSTNYGPVPNLYPSFAWNLENRASPYPQPFSPQYYQSAYMNPPYYYNSPMSPYSMNPPTSSYATHRTPNHLSNTRTNFRNSPRPVPQTPINLLEKRCWSCGQPGHLQKDCPHLNG